MSRRTNVAHSYNTHGNAINHGYQPHQHQQAHQHQHQQHQQYQQHHSTISPNSSYTSSNNIGTHRSASPVHRPLVVGNRVSSYYGSDVEVSVENEEKVIIYYNIDSFNEYTNSQFISIIYQRDRMGQHYSMNNSMATGGKRTCRMSNRHPVDKGLVDLLPQILIFLLACVIVTFWMPISRWIGALLWPLSGEHVMPSTGYHLRDNNPLHTDAYDPNTGMPTAANGNPLVMAHA
jgi:hypothetical protein